MSAIAVSCVDFFSRVLRMKLTNGQTAFVAVAVDGVLPRALSGPVGEAAIALFGDIDGIPSIAKRTIVAVLGRDSGKTQLGAGIALYKLLTCDLSRLGPGDVGTCAVVAPRERTARIALRRAVALVNGVRDLRRLLVGVPRKDGFTLQRPDGAHVVFEVFAASAGGASLRGPSFIVVIFDEAAQFRDTDSSVNDAELYSAVMPRVLPGGLVLFLSTPWSEEGLFWSLASTNHEAPQTAIVARGPTLLMRDNDPHLVEAIEAERLRDADNCLREFFVEAMSVGGSAFFDGRSLDDAIDDDLVIPVGTLREGERVGVGADIGLVKDSSALVALGARGMRGQARFRVLQLLEQRPSKGLPLKLSAVVAAFAREVRTYRATGFMADGHAREPAREWATREQIQIYPRPEGPNVKHDTFVGLREAFRDRRIALPRHPRLLAQLRSISVKPMPGGLWKITQPRRVGIAHGDLVSALVLAHYSAGGGRNPMIAALAGRPSADLASYGRPITAVAQQQQSTSSRLPTITVNGAEYLIPSYK